MADSKYIFHWVHSNWCRVKNNHKKTYFSRIFQIPINQQRMSLVKLVPRHHQHQQPKRMASQKTARWRDSGHSSKITSSVHQPKNNYQLFVLRCILFAVYFLCVKPNKIWKPMANFEYSLFTDRYFQSPIGLDFIRVVIDRFVFPHQFLALQWRGRILYKSISRSQNIVATIKNPFKIGCLLLLPFEWYLGYGFLWFRYGDALNFQRFQSIAMHMIKERQNTLRL